MGNLNIKVIDIEKTLDFIIENKCSVSRFGDGEIDIISGHSIPYQEYNEQLANKLRTILNQQSNEKFLVCLSDIFENQDRYNSNFKFFWQGHLEKFEKLYKDVCTADWYGSTFLSRPYIDLEDKSKSSFYFEKLKSIWNNRDILIVEGFNSRSGVGNDLFSNAKSIERIICSSKNAYSEIEWIKSEIKRYGKNKLVLLMLGPTAKVISYELSKEGFWLIDIGHIDSEYEWFKMGATHKVKLKNKHTAEHNYDENIVFDNDLEYNNQIVAINNKKLISVIVPFHNGEKYLDECIQSILKQTYQNIELILVNAESTDKSLEIANKYISENVKIYNEKYNTLCFALKKGIEKSTAEYVAIIKAEDFIREDFIEKLYENIEKNNCDMALSNYYKYSEKDGLFYFHNFEEDYGVESFEFKEAVLRQDRWIKNGKLLNNNLYNFLNGKLYKKWILEEFGHFTIEEKEIMKWLYNKCKNITLVNENLYAVRECLEKQGQLAYNKDVPEDNLISIIIPVYNAEKYLVECLESVKNQTYKNLEVLLINDGSTDNSEQICRQFVEKDNRFKVFGGANKGAAYSRNKGIELSSGELIYFLDSDDFIDKNCIKVLYNQHIIHNADTVSANYLKYIEMYGTYEYYVLDKDFKIEEVTPYDAVVRQSAWHHNVSNYIITNNKLYKKELFKDILFPESRIFEDDVITHKLLMKSKKIISVNSNYYFYRIRKNSVMTSNFSLKRVDDLIYMINEKLSDIAMYGNGKYLYDARNRAYKLLLDYKKMLENNNLVEADVYKYILTKINLYNIGNN
ncbi:SP_1767 family glycosyltransferase [Gemelliphila palaticanis]|uniref:SP_1767 family glycosyltransferase n=1 Tax=Gemelliphila palaticanis TaxID=81950 RepID=A0ABX2T0C4_9BACL|nr:SP_1767 family glycosyltransferase [Gemella palaticanis]MBF0716089.1 SP_1767 family glycosyltransferase [Gemella palaticanis]NYS48019.1 SP_1767 family glycosyltransferase [Gemella palaticanis]